MKKFVLVILLLVGVLMMSACNEKQSSAKEVKEDVEVINAPVDKEESVDEVVDEVEIEETTETDKDVVSLNYENTKAGVETEVFKLLSNLNVVLTMGDKNPWTLEVIKSWFIDFDHSNTQAGIYIDKLTEIGVILSNENDGPRVFKKTEQVGENVWDLEVEVTDTYNDLTTTTMWYLVAQPNNEGKMTINIKEIK